MNYAAELAAFMGTGVDITIHHRPTHCVCAGRDGQAELAWAQ